MKLPEIRPQRLALPVVMALCLALAPSPARTEGQGDLRLVVQQNGQALVTEVRSLDLPKGDSSVLLQDLPTTLDPQTLQVRSKIAPKAMLVRDFSLDVELLTPSTLLRRHLGKRVMLVLPDGKTQGGRVRKDATLLSVDEAPLFFLDGTVYSGPYEAIIYPELPKGLSPRPRLAMNVSNSGPARQELELAYLAREISWRMDYVLTMDKASSSGLLSGWVTLANRSGKDFPEANIELLAGEPRSVQPRAMPMRAMLAADAMVSAKAESAEQEELFEYHLYRLKRPVTLADQQSRQAPLFEAAAIPVKRRLVGRASALPSGREAEPRKQQLEAVITLQNTPAQGLGLPLPKGTLRAFQEDDGTRHFLGDVQVERTAVGSSLELRLGQVFDVSVERVVTDYERTGKNSYRATWELRLRNGKKQAQQIVLQELLPGKWKIEAGAPKWTKTAAGVAEFVVDVPPSRDAEPLVLRYGFTTEL